MSTLVFPRQPPSRTKIVATLGPASDSEEKLHELLDAGVDVFRLNMAHGGPKDGQIRLDKIRKVSAELGISVAVLADLAGPKMRLGLLPGDSYDCEPDVPIRIVRGHSTTEPNTFTTTYEPLVDELEVGNRIMLADGTVALEVVEKNKDDVLCKVIQSGTVRSRQGVNLPGAKLSIKTLQPEDIENAKWAFSAGVDFLGMSFVRTPEDLLELRAILLKEAGGNDELIPHIIAKIEKPEAIARLEQIVDVADGVMVARGDLGVEIDIAQIAVTQKKIIALCRRKNKPVIVATQMLESMHHLRIPTRAEATDVANAILDGADACMLSGETAVGENPVLAVKMMHRIADATEAFEHYPAEITEHCMPKKEEDGTISTTAITDSLCDAAVHLAGQIDATLLLVTSHTGRMAMVVSGKRCKTLTIGMSRNERALRRMNLYWGVIPVLNAPSATQEKLAQVIEAGKAVGYLSAGDRVVMISGETPESKLQNLLHAHVVD